MHEILVIYILYYFYCFESHHAKQKHSFLLLTKYSNCHQIVLGVVGLDRMSIGANDCSARTSLRSRTPGRIWRSLSPLTFYGEQTRFFSLSFSCLISKHYFIHQNNEKMMIIILAITET